MMQDDEVTPGRARPIKPGRRRLKIAIATLGRFHVLDLARELAALGHEVRFYSYVPKRRAIRFGLPADCHVALLPWLFPVVFLQLLLGNRVTAFLERILFPWANRVLQWRLECCDVFIGMSGLCLEAAMQAKKRFGARVILERGSRHILSQKRILAAIPGAAGPTSFVVKRELAGYQAADMISVPSRHVVESFEEHGFPRERLMVNPYGVDFARFQSMPLRQPPSYDVIFVGGWTLQKGCDTLVLAMNIANELRMLHVGQMGDAPFPSINTMSSIGPIDQLELPAAYGTAKVLVLPSRQEGLALVQIQALACGLAVVCTDRTGGADLQDWIQFPEAIVVVPIDDPIALAEGMRKAIAVSDRLRGQDLLGAAGRSYLSWTAYGRRYEDCLYELLERSSR